MPPREPPAPGPTAATTSQHFIIGTAGHVDHGKTSLIRALTGTETDRLREEQERGMSIDLGFADFILPSGRHAGVVDVPGHERFLKNMLAGAGGMDLVLLVVAADEGVMPQTREHLEILHLLRTHRGLVVLTKADLVDEEWLELVREDVRAALRGTFLEQAPVVAVSSTTGAGLDELRAALDRLAEEASHRPIVGPWRLPIDRAFTIGGFGTVVTGTLVAGVARVGDRVALLPRGGETRVRGLQVHGRSVTFAEAGSRVAMNLAGMDLEGVTRGDVAAPPGAYQPTQALDARLEVLKSCPREVKQRTRVRVYLGTAEVLARLHLLDRDVLLPGESGLVQLRLEEPAVTVKGDRFVLRFYSPLALLGGGTVLDPTAPRHRRHDAAVLEALAVRERGSPEELVAQAVERQGLSPAAPALVARSLGLPEAEVAAHMAALVAAGTLVPVGEAPGAPGRSDPAAVVHRHRLEAAEHQVLTSLESLHRAQPMRAGMSREELRSRLSRQMDARGYSLVLARLEAQGRVRVTGAQLCLADHTPSFNPEQQRLAAALEAGLLADPFNAPFFEELCAAAGVDPRAAAVREVWDALLTNGVVVRIAGEVFLHQRAVEDAVARVRAYLEEHGQITAAQFRDLLGTSRKYAVPLMEYLDTRRVTRRVGDYRVLHHVPGTEAGP